MKAVLVVTSLLLFSHCAVASKVLEPAFKWLQSYAPQGIEFKVEKSAIRFNGCKQKEYFALFNQPLSEKFVVELGLGYAKGRHSMGVFNQRISVKEFSLVPRYQLNHQVSIGFGMVAQSETEFRTTQGLEFNLPKNKEWMLNARKKGFARDHYWELAVSNQTWDATDEFGLLFDNGLTDNKLALSYSGFF